MASVRFIGLQDPSIDFTFSDNPENSIDFSGAQKWASIAIPRQEGSILQNMGSDPLLFGWSGVLDGDNAFTDTMILDAIRKSGAPLKFLYLDFSIECVILEFNFRLTTPREALDRFFYDIKLQRYYPNLALSRLAPLEISLTGQQISTLNNKVSDLQGQVTGFDAIVASLSSGDILGAVAGVSDSVNASLEAVTTALGNLRQGIQQPLYTLQAIDQQVKDSSTLVKQSIDALNDIADTPNQMISTLRDMTVSLDFIAKAPFIAVSEVTTVTVQDGDTIEALAEFYLGSFESWRVIVNANPQVKDPNILVPGTILVIPQ